MTPVIRSATSNDLPALIEIERASFSYPQWDAGDFLRYVCIVAEIDAQIAGFLVSRETFPGSAEALPEREILNLAVAPAYRRMGIATLLLRRELQHSADHFLEVRESNVAARALYGKLGFVEVGSRKQYYGFPTERAIVMQMKKC